MDLEGLRDALEWSFEPADTFKQQADRFRNVEG
jgi:hypothetical protein